MVLTINYGDLQNIKKNWINEKTSDKKKIYNHISDCKDTLTYMYKHNSVKGKSREDYEIELMEFAKSMISNTDIPAKELESKFSGKPLIINNEPIKLWLN